MSYFSTIKLISDYLKLDTAPEFDFTPTYHQVAQTYCKWPVALNEGAIKIKLFEWGLIADYMNTPEKIKQYRSSMANARSEKMLDDNRSVWHRLRHKRCLVFCTGFFEHRDIGLKKKQPYFISLKGEPVFCMAGLYNYSPIPDLETGEMTGTFSIITRPANELMKKIHNSGEHSDRMPLVLSKEFATKWLSKELADEEIREICAFCLAPAAMQAWPVDTIRKRKEDTVAILDEIKNEHIPSL
jgi:putative SOS response-associated peptidase YedK